MKNKAFTLIELMVVIVIIGILAAVAVPSYTHYVARTKIADAYVFSDFMKKLQLTKFSENNYFVYAGTSGDSVTALANGERVTMADHSWAVMEYTLASDGLSLNATNISEIFSPAYSPQNFAIESWGGGGGAAALQASNQIVFVPGTESVPNGSKCTVNVDASSTTVDQYGVDDTADSGHRWFSIALMANFPATGSDRCFFMVQTGQTDADGNISVRPIIEIN